MPTAMPAVTPRLTGRSRCPRRARCLCGAGRASFARTSRPRRGRVVRAKYGVKQPAPVSALWPGAADATLLTVAAMPTPPAPLRRGCGRPRGTAHAPPSRSSVRARGTRSPGRWTAARRRSSAARSASTNESPRPIRWFPTRQPSTSGASRPCSAPSASSSCASSTASAGVWVSSCAFTSPVARTSSPRARSSPAP